MIVPANPGLGLIPIVAEAQKSGKATKATERATDGSFFGENITGSESLTDEEIAAGRWLSEQAVGSGMRWVML